MSTIQPSPPTPPTSTVEQHVDPYASGLGYRQKPNSPNVGYTPQGGKFPLSSPPPLVGGKILVGIPQIGAQPYLNPPYLGMNDNVWQPNFPIQPSLIMDPVLNSQPMSSTSQIPAY